MNSFTTEAFTELAFGLTLIALRTYARWESVGFRNFMFDDYLILLAAVSNSHPSFLHDGIDPSLGGLLTRDRGRILGRSSVPWPSEQQHDSQGAHNAVSQLNGIPSASGWL